MKKIPQKSALCAKNMQFLFLTVFLFLTILYYFLRFQFNMPTFFALAQAGTMSLLSFTAFIGLISGKFRIIGKLDFIMVLMLFHSLFFSVYVGARDGMYGGGWAVMTSLMPVLVYFYTRNSLNFADADRIIMWLQLVLLIVAVIYLTEFIHFHVLGRGYLKYSILLDAHAIEKGYAGGVSKSWAQGANYRLVRLAGPLSHNNVTGLALATGLVLSFTRFITTQKSLWGLLLIIVFFSALFLSAARTAIVAGGVGIIVSMMVAMKFSFIRHIGRLLAGGLILGFIIYVLIVTRIADPLALKQVFGCASLMRTLKILVNHHTIEIFCNQIAAYPFILITGAGPSTPVMQPIGAFYPVMSEDVFIFSILSRYGFILPILLFFGAWLSLRESLAVERERFSSSAKPILAASFGSLAAFVTSSAHTNAMMRPQLFPVFFVFLAVIAIIHKKACIYRNGKPVGDGGD